MTIYMIEFLKRTAGHRGCLHTSLLKSPKFFGVSSPLGHNVEVDGNAEAFTCAQVRPTPTPDLENHFMVTYGKVCYIYSFHKTFGYKMYVIA